MRSGGGSLRRDLGLFDVVAFVPKQQLFRVLSLSAGICGNSAVSPCRGCGQERLLCAEFSLPAAYSGEDPATFIITRILIQCTKFASNNAGKTIRRRNEIVTARNLITRAAPALIGCFE